MTTSVNKDEFTGWRAAIWPIHNHELKKFLPLGFIMFCILFNYTLLRDTKDALVVNASSSGSGVITFLKLYCVTPAAVLFVLFYSKLTNMLSKEAVFYAVVTPFLVFFGLFGFVITPNLDLLHPSAATIASLHKSYPNLSGFIDIYGYWAYSLFYILAEIWGSAMIALMFWQFANEIVRVNESKRFYGLFVVIGNISLLFSGTAVTFFSTGIKDYYPDNTWQYSLYFMMSMVVAMGVLAMMTYRWMHTDVLNDPRYYDGAVQKPKKKKAKPSLAESVKILISTPELGLIAMLIIAYGITINLVEVQWKQQLKLYSNGDMGAFNSFMGQFSFYTGLLTIIFSLFVGSRVLRAVSWFVAAAITPTTILAGGALFFCFILSADIQMIKAGIEGLLESLSTNPITAATFLGAAVVILSKSIKYSLFDPTKEMAYIPLGEEQRSKGKAAVDVIGGRAGKAGGAFVQSSMMILMATKDVILIAPYTFAIFAVVCVLWMYSVKALSVHVNAGIERKRREQLEGSPAAA